MTFKMWKVLKFILDFQKSEGYAPSHYVISIETSMSRTYASRHVGYLKHGGWLTKASTSPRDLYVLQGPLPPQPDAPVDEWLCMSDRIDRIEEILNITNKGRE